MVRSVGILFYDNFLEGYYFVSYVLSPQYDKDRDLVRPYFDEKFYLKKYGETVKKSGLQPIDHFIRKGWYTNNWRNHTDPNKWFNTTLYQKHLWDIVPGKHLTKVHPFVDFLTQAGLHKHSKTIEVWTRHDEINRTWLAVEGLMRLDRWQVILHVPPRTSSTKLIAFMPQIIRGLKIVFDTRKNTSFYRSDFIRNPARYSLITAPTKTEAYYTDMLTYVRQNFIYLEHHPYVSLWREQGKINPTVINIICAYEEPLQYGKYVGNFLNRLQIIIRGFIHDGMSGIRELRVKEFQDYLTRIASGFELYILNFNCKPLIIPS